ncbi:hypothetical protein N4Q66_27130, partial [Leclercia adecarboxylata]|uniref:hypothetical protein n=1 Tax=Leclercia adecarboxylata TaxID=83655 RepID=UPI00234D24A1
TDGGFSVFLRDFPISSLTSVEYRSGTYSSSTWNTYSPDFIEGYCGVRRFKTHTVSNEVHDTDGGFSVFLRDFPISSLTSV